MPGNRDSEPTTEGVPAPDGGGLTDPATWVAIYLLGALVALYLIRRGFRPAIPS